MHRIASHARKTTQHNIGRRRPKRSDRARRVTTLVLALVALLGLTPSAGAVETAPTCHRYDLPVSVHAGSPTDQRIAGWLCAIGPTTGKTVQLLVHGFTLDHTYWDPSYQPNRYSYVQAMTRAGYATFTIDRLGAGASSHPPAAELTVENHAWTVHQTTQALRAGTIGGTRFSKVVLVGHSLGSAVAQTEASRYQDVDALILSGWMHTPLWLGTPGVILTALPAQLDPRFPNLPLGYVAPLPHAHKNLLVDTNNADTTLLALDEQHAQTGSLAEEVTVVPTILPPLTQHITAPVLLATGQNDSIFCGPLTPCPNAATVRTREAPMFTSTPRFDTFVLPDAGHMMNVQRNAPAFFSASLRWLNSISAP
ncbi:alpha/beta hydrolase [Sciscionella marina]|uniref:alpha/beta hydrolase n=1 Tax=Sciscionella marina TaxID=508770 RepID=UPI000360D476|nr:alpha/beta fold hydrolase [Sciscionella marina]